MTVQQTDEIIAKYMGFYTMGSIMSWSAPASIFHIYGNSWFTADQLKFNSSIEWICPVARKVKEELYVFMRKTEGKDMRYYPAGSIYMALVHAGGDFDISKVYPVVVEAIEFLNKQKEG